MVDPFPDQGAIPFRRRRDAGGVINAVVAFMRQNARELFVGYIALVAPFTILSALSLVLLLNRFGDVMGDIDAYLADPDLIIALFGPSYALLLVSQGLAFAFSQGAVAGFVRLYREGEAGVITPSVLWAEAKGLVFPVIGMYLILVIAGIPLFIVGAILIGTLPAFLGALIWIAVMGGLLPIVHVWFASRMTESSNVLTAAGRAYDLVVRGEWFRSFGAILLTWIVVLGAWFVLAMALQVVVSVIGINSTIEDPAQITRAVSLWFVPVQILGSLIYIPPALAAFFLHGSLVEDLDGPSVDDELDLLERGVDAAPTPGWDTPEAPPTPSPASGERPSRDPSPPPAPEAEPPRPPGGFRGGGFS